MKTKLLLAVLTFLIPSGMVAASPVVGTADVAQKFETALRWENAGLWVPAGRAYRDVLQLIPTTPDVQETSFYRLYGAVATYRLAMVSVQTAYTGLAKLTDQVSTLQSVSDHVDAALAQLTALPALSPAEKLWMSLLYNARATLGVAITYHLLNGVVWKHYIIYPLDGLSGILATAASDYRRSLAYLDQKPANPTSWWRRLLIWLHIRDADTPAFYRLVDQHMAQIVRVETPETVNLTCRALKASDVKKAEQNLVRLYLRSYQARQVIGNTRIVTRLRDADEANLEAVIGNRRLFKTIDQLAQSAGLLYDLR
ncbi:MAG: hypothetical protein AAB066_01335 [Candidatus Margulisiibacteriota bacterium]